MHQQVTVLYNSLNICHNSTHFSPNEETHQHTNVTRWHNYFNFKFSLVKSIFLFIMNYLQYISQAYFVVAQKLRINSLEKNSIHLSMLCKAFTSLLQFFLLSSIPHIIPHTPVILNYTAFSEDIMFIDIEFAVMFHLPVMYFPTLCNW